MRARRGPQTWPHVPPRAAQVWTPAHRVAAWCGLPRGAEHAGSPGGYPGVCRRLVGQRTPWGRGAVTRARGKGPQTVLGEGTRPRLAGGAVLLGGRSGGRHLFREPPKGSGDPAARLPGTRPQEREVVCHGEQDAEQVSVSRGRTTQPHGRRLTPATTWVDPTTSCAVGLARRRDRPCPSPLTRGPNVTFAGAEGRRAPGLAGGVRVSWAQWASWGRWEGSRDGWGDAVHHVVMSLHRVLKNG